MQKRKLKKFNKIPSVQRQLFNIYKDKNGHLPDISKIYYKKRSGWKIFLLSFVLGLTVLAGVAWLGFFIFNSKKSVSDQSIKLEFVASQNIASGEEINYVLNYQNKEKISLKDVEIIIRYPEGFEFFNAEPLADNEFNNVWQVGTLAAGKRGQIKIEGKIIGEIGSIKIINATASFVPENFQSVFKETASFSSQITSSILDITLEGPEQTLVEKKISYKIAYKNTSERDLNKIQIRVIYPENFVFQSAKPEPFHREDEARKFNNIWYFEQLKSEEKGEIIIEGGYLADEKEQKDFKAQIGFLTDGDEFSLQQEKTITTKIINQNLSLNLIINGQNSDQPVSFGQNLNYSIIYKNLGQSELNEISISVIIDSEVLDWDTLQDKNGGIIENNTITWAKEQISVLDLLRPLDEGTIDFAIKVKEASEINLNQINLQTKNKAVAKISKINDLESGVVIESNPIINNINTDLQLKVEGRYFDDDNIAVGTGPLPPIVGQTTSFRIYWYLANSLHEVKEVEVSVALPAGIEWVDKFYVKAGKLQYSSKSNKVIWTISRIPPNKSYDDINSWFDVSVTPTKQQVRKLLILIDQVNLIAKDAETDAEINKTAKAVTSNLEDDPIGGGRGLVIDITE